MITIAFWNTYGNNGNGNNVDSLIVELIKERNIDLMVLCEYKGDSHMLCSKLEFENLAFSSTPYCEGDRVKMIYSSTTLEAPRLVRNQDFYTIVRFPESKLTVVGVHLLSNMYADDETRKMSALNCRNDIEEYEEECVDRNTVVIGDFNADPYESTLMSAIGFHALPVQKKAEKSRKVTHKEMLPFYNPMWNLFGDFCEPFGTYYMSTTNAYDPMWHLYDQILVRGILARKIIKESVKIIGKIGTVKLCTDYGIPNKAVASDHLPIIISMEV